MARQTVGMSISIPQARCVSRLVGVSAPPSQHISNIAQTINRRETIARATQTKVENSNPVVDQLSIQKVAYEVNTIKNAGSIDTTLPRDPIPTLNSSS
jgi:hypothetical protein